MFQVIDHASTANPNVGRTTGLTDVRRRAQAESDIYLSSVVSLPLSVYPQVFLLSFNMSSTPVTLNVTGTQFKVSAGTFEKLRLLSPESRTMLDECVLPERKGEVFLERHPACFEALLHLCVHGELHMPPVVCPQVFKVSYGHTRQVP